MGSGRSLQGKDIDLDPPRVMRQWRGRGPGDPAGCEERLVEAVYICGLQRVGAVMHAAGEKGPAREGVEEVALDQEMLEAFRWT